jgi:hypothetical protein
VLCRVNIHFNKLKMKLLLCLITHHPRNVHMQLIKHHSTNRNLCHGTGSLLACRWRPGFNPRPVHVEFVVDKVALGQVFV